MGVFDEGERRKTIGGRSRSRERAVGQPWPLSARVLVGVLFVLNILLGALLVRTEIKSPGASPRLTLERPKAGTPPQADLPSSQGPPSAEDPSPEVKAPSTGAEPAAAPRTGMTGGGQIKGLRAGGTERPDMRPPMPRAKLYVPREPAGQTPAAIRNPAAPPDSSANVTSPAVAATIGNTGAGIREKTEPPRSTPAPSVHTPPAIGRESAGKGTQSGSTRKVASVGLPAMEKGLAIPKMPVARLSPKLEIVPRSDGELENCGDEDHFVACPTLHNRPESPDNQ